MSLPRYAAYKNSGVVWLGEIPVHWDIAPLKRMLDIQNGSDHKQIEVADGYPVIGSGGPFAYASEYIYDGESVLLGRKGTVDRPMYVTGKFWTVDTMYWTKVSPDASGKFCYYAALTIPFDLYSTNTALPSMTKGVLSAHPIARPPYEEQSAIAAFLDRETGKIDALIAEQEKLLTLLAEKRQATISHAVTRGLNSNAPMKDSGVPWLGDVPEHWQVRTISSLSTKITNGFVGPTRDVLVDEGVRYLQSLHIKGNSIRFDSPYYVRQEWSEAHAKSILATGDVLIVQTGDIGQVAVVSDEFAGCNCHALIIVTPVCDVVAGEWLSWALNSDYGFHSLLSIQTGALHPHLNCGNVKNLFMPVPPIDDQSRIIAYLQERLHGFEDLSGEAERAITLLKERRSALIAAAVTGKIDVRQVA